ncbi:hypothetical protein BIW11_03895 [Tropilaelaps mercedesae]|uniref:MH2 domain-containing protein n=1 Tax=Tropilaelaps mercedesae TaxID=418985 RepID=A0A1V9XE52_9ACAR|nr:hypothetical protein BIW11_03895 [Tropilaelaps mercedesae]
MRVGNFRKPVCRCSFYGVRLQRTPSPRPLIASACVNYHKEDDDPLMGPIQMSCHPVGLPLKMVNVRQSISNAVDGLHGFDGRAKNTRIDHIQEVLHKWEQIDDEIWAKIICMERNRRVAKAYARAPELEINGSSDGFDGFKIGLNAFDNPMRDEKTHETKKRIGMVSSTGALRPHHPVNLARQPHIHKKWRRCGWIHTGTRRTAGRVANGHLCDSFALALTWRFLAPSRFQRGTNITSIDIVPSVSESIKEQNRNRLSAVLMLPPLSGARCSDYFGAIER